MTGSGPDGGTGLTAAVGDTSSGATGTASGGTPGMPPDGVPNEAAAAASASQTSGRGFDAHHVYIGLNTINNASTFFKAVGAGDVTFGDMKADAEAIIADINAHGGVQGRKLVGTYHDEDVTQATTNPSANAQTTCAALTQDHKVVAAAINDTAGDDNDTFYSCMKKADTPFFTAADTLLDQPWIDQYRGYLRSMQGPTAQPFAPVFVNRLAALRYFARWNTTLGRPGSAAVKTGLLFPDTPTGHRNASLFARLIAAKGVPSESFFVSSDSVSNAASDLQAAILRFKSDGVTHVLTNEPSIPAFMISAEQQAYRPRYALSSLVQPAAGAGKNAPAAQLNGALGVGWQPLTDVGEIPGSAAAKSCLLTLKRHGIDYSGNLQPTAIALYICDQVRLISQALNATTGLSTQSLTQGVARVGHLFQPSTTFLSGLSGTRSDVVGAARDLGYNNSCSCFVYLSSTLRPV